MQAPSRPQPGNVAVRHVGTEARPLIERFGQLFAHDMSAFRGSLPDADGRYPLGRLPKAFTEPGWRAYLVEWGGSPVGYALTRPLDDGAQSVTEFFIVRGARRGGVGLAAVRTLWEGGPGRWAVAFQRANAGAEAFWRAAATAVAGTAWTEQEHPVPGRPDLPPDVWLRLDSRRTQEGPARRLSSPVAGARLS